MSKSSELGKKAKAYIVECIDSEAYEVKTTTDAEKVQFLYSTFLKEKGYEIKRIGEMKALSDWFSGLPSVLNLAFTYHDIIALAKEWGSIPEDATEKEEDKICQNYWHFMANKALQLFRKYKEA